MVDKLNYLYSILAGFTAIGVVVRCGLILLKAKSEEIPFNDAFQKCKKVIFAGIMIIGLMTFIEFVREYYLPS